MIGMSTFLGSGSKCTQLELVEKDATHLPTIISKINGQKEFTSIIWEDDEIRASWASLKTMEVAATHCLQTPLFVKNSEIAKENIFKNSDKDRLDLFTLYDHQHQIHRNDKYKQSLITPWRKILRIFMGVYFVVFKTENFEEISTLEHSIMKNTPINPVPLRPHQPGNLYKEFISHIMARLGERMLFTTLIRSMSTTHVHNVLEINQSISRLLTPEAQYGKAFTKYMRFIDLAERMVLAGIKNMDLIKSLASMETKEVEHILKPLKCVKGFNDMHEILFHRGVLGERYSLPYFKTSFQGEDMHTAQLIKGGFQRRQYLASGKMIQVLNTLQGIKSGQVGVGSIPEAFKMLKSWEVFSKGIDGSICEKRLSLNKLTHMITFAIQILEDEDERFVLLHVVECFLGQLKPLKDINCDLFLESAINSIMFFFLIKEISAVVGSLITLEDIHSVSGSRLLVLQSIQFFQASLKSTLIQTNHRRREKYYELNQIMHTEIGKIYRVYLSLTHHFNNLSAMAHGQLLTEACIQNLMNDIDLIPQLNTKELAYTSLFRKYDTKAGKEQKTLSESQNTRYKYFLSSSKAFHTKYTGITHVSMATTSAEGIGAGGVHIQKRIKLFGSFIDKPDTFSSI